MLAAVSFLFHCLLNDMLDPLWKREEYFMLICLYLLWQIVSETFAKEKDMIHSALPLEQREYMWSAEKKGKMYVLWVVPRKNIHIN